MKLFKNAECNSELTSFSLKNTAATYHIFCVCSFTQKKNKLRKTNMQQQQKVSMMCSPLVDMFWVYIIKKKYKICESQQEQIASILMNR